MNHPRPAKASDTPELAPQELRARLGRDVAICTVLLALAGFGAFLGVRLMIEGPHHTVDETHRFSRVLYTMPDRTTCRVVLYDNTSAQLSDGPVVPCDPKRKTTSYVESRDFKWGR